ncbi:MAG: hypothetical protein HY541_07270 [Deltaproteobacteria bacterium]|nr:hypothetical protein [Deltaproteobacteria bacterium]
MIFKNLAVFLLLVAVHVFLTGCSLFGSVSDTDDSGQPSLTDGDFPDVSPCSDRDILPSDSVFLETLTNADELILTHKAYTDDSGLTAACGLADEDNSLNDDETAWDPLAGTDVDACNSFDEELADFLAFSDDFYMGICRSTFSFDSGDVADGFPRAGIYRMDGCVEYDRKSYDIRARITISGASVNRTWESLTLAGTEDLEVFDDGGSEVTTVDEMKFLFVQNSGRLNFTVRSGDGVTTHLAVTVQAICISTAANCPTLTDDEACE